MSFLGRLNYIGRFVAQSTVVCEPIFKPLKKDAPTKWTEQCQTAFGAIKNYLSNIPVLVPPRERNPLLLYMSVSDSAFRCILGQHDETRKKGKGYVLHKKEVYSIRISLHSFRECVLCFDLACPEVETLFVFLYYIPHFQNESIEVYFPEGDADWKVS